MTVFAWRRKADPWWDLEGVSARRNRIRRQVVGGAAFLTSEIACGLTLAVWLLHVNPGLRPFPG